jgi:hypothetical protein
MQACAWVLLCVDRHRSIQISRFPILRISYYSSAYIRFNSVSELVRNKNNLPATKRRIRVLMGKCRSEAVKESVATSCLVDCGHILASIEIYCRLSATNSSSFHKFFVSTYFCEEAFSQITIIKSKYRNPLTYERLKYCLRLCLSSSGAFFSNLWKDMQCHASTST